MSIKESIIDKLTADCKDPECATQKGTSAGKLCEYCFNAILNLSQDNILEMYNEFVKATEDMDYIFLLFNILSEETRGTILLYLLEEMLVDVQKKDLEIIIKGSVKEEYFEIANQLMLHKEKK